MADTGRAGEGSVALGTRQKPSGPHFSLFVSKLQPPLELPYVDFCRYV